MVRPEKPKYKVIEDTLDLITKEKRTKATYRSYINKYFEILNVKNPDTYFTSNRDYTKDIWKVAKQIDTMPPKTQQCLVSSVKRFLTRNKVNIETLEWEDITKRNKLNKAYALTRDIIPTPNQLKKLLQFANPNLKTCLIFLATTGCRIDETLQLTWDDIDLEKRMVTLLPETTKGDKERFTFFTPECKEMLELWKVERDRFLIHGMKKSIYVRNQLAKKGYDIKKSGDKWAIYKDGKKIPRETVLALDQRVFPFSAQTVTISWHGLLEQLGEPFNERYVNPRFQNEKGRYRYHIHSLRKFWFHQFQGTPANKNHIDFMGAHQSLLDATYTDFLNEPDKLKETYDSYSSCLMIFEREPDTSDIREQLAERNAEMQGLKQTIEDNKMQILELRVTIQEIKNEK